MLQAALVPDISLLHYRALAKSRRTTTWRWAIRSRLEDGAGRRPETPLGTVVSAEPWKGKVTEETARLPDQKKEPTVCSCLEGL